MTVTRKKKVIDPITEEDTFVDEVVYDSIPCALSSTNSSSTAPQKDSTNHRRTAEYNFKIFAGPDIFCQTGDKVLVITLNNHEYKGIAGRSMGYPSHSETPMRVEVMS